MEEKFTIRTSTWQLFGEFATREDAWAAVNRVRKAGHDTMDCAAVVPLLAGVTPKPMHPAWLSDAPEPTPQYTPADVDALLKRFTELTTELEQTRAERDRFREHSVTLNSVSFAMAEALGDVAPGADSAEGHPEALVTRLVGTLAYRQAKCDDMRKRLVALANLAENDAENLDESGELARAALAIIGEYGWPADAREGQPT